MYQSIPSANIPPPGKPQGKFFEVVKSPALGKNTPTPGEYFRRSSQPFLLIGVEILGLCGNQTLKRTGRLSNYSFSYPLVSV